MLKNYLTPKQASAELGISTSTITRCVQRGAPVHRWGSCGKTYRIILDEFVTWMEAQGEANQGEQRRKMSLAEMRAARHRICG